MSLVLKDQGSRRFQIQYAIGRNKPDVYRCTSNPHSGEAALVEFHNHMQRARLLPFDSYRITSFGAQYPDIKDELVFSEYDLPKTANPDVSCRRSRNPEIQPPNMFNDAEIIEESKRARR